MELSEITTVILSEKDYNRIYAPKIITTFIQNGDIRDVTTYLN